MSEAKKAKKHDNLWENLCDLPENVIGEIFNNELIVSPRPSPRHASVSSSLGVQIGGPFQFGKDGGPGDWVIVDEPELHFERPAQGTEKENVVVPDLAGWKRKRLPELPKTSYFELPPDWICEITSPSTYRYDRVSKLQIYAANNIPYYWIIDPVAEVLEILVFDGEVYKLQAVFKENDKVSTLPFEAIEFELGTLWYPVEKT